MSWDDHADEDWVDDEGDDDDALLQCPACGKDVHEDTQQCPHCRDWITPVYPETAKRPVWWILIVVLLIVSLLTMFS